MFPLYFPLEISGNWIGYRGNNIFSDNAPHHFIYMNAFTRWCLLSHISPSWKPDTSEVTVLCSSYFPSAVRFFLGEAEMQTVSETFPATLFEWPEDYQTDKLLQCLFGSFGSRVASKEKKKRRKRKRVYIKCNACANQDRAGDIGNDYLWLKQIVTGVAFPFWENNYKQNQRNEFFKGERAAYASKKSRSLLKRNAF